MEIYLYALIFVCGLFAGLYIGKVGELHRARKGKQNGGPKGGNNK